MRVMLIPLRASASVRSLSTAASSSFLSAERRCQRVLFRSMSSSAVSIKNNKIRGSITSKGPIIALYRSILRAHTWLPETQRDLGDAFVKHEFREHKDASPEVVVAFITEWQHYLEKLTEQIARMPEKKMSGGSLGEDIPEELLGEMSADQRAQLANLEFEAKTSLNNKK